MKKLNEYILENYPQYWGIQHYPKDKVAKIHKITEPLGILSNFGHTNIIIGDKSFNTTERLYQMLKFNTTEAQKIIYNVKGNPKMTTKHLQKTRPEMIRENWGEIFIDVMKWCLYLKYQQDKDFLRVLQETKELFIIEDQTTFVGKNANCWGVKLKDNEYVGPNLLGRLLMELRDNPIECKSFENLILI
jgi:ribA/ribD-fused uncharacterized protein